MLVVHVYHVVEACDTMLDIALQYKMNFAQLLMLNPPFNKEMDRGGRDINKVCVGELIRIQ